MLTKTQQRDVAKFAKDLDADPAATKQWAERLGWEAFQPYRKFLLEVRSDFTRSKARESLTWLMKMDEPPPIELMYYR